MRSDISLLSLNRGVVSRLGLARPDVKRLALAAEDQTNWMPRVLGPMTLRAGLGYIGATASNAAARLLRFIFATDDTALLELTNTAMRVWIDDELLTRPSVSTAITNGTFDTDLTGWTDIDESGADSDWATGGYMELVGTGTNRAGRRQQVTVSAPDQNIEHGIRIVVHNGPVVLRIGSTSGGDEYFTEGLLGTGTHSISITPTGNFYIQFQSSLERTIYVNSCTIESAGAVSITTPWLAADLGNVRCDQSGDIVFAACAGYQQRRIERRGTRPGARTWSVVLYEPEDGPFNPLNVTPITLTPSVLNGDGTLTASRAYFTTDHVGALFSITSSGQSVETLGVLTNDTTDSIVVTGTGTERTFSVVISGITTSTVDLQRSYDNTTWADVGGSGTFSADSTTAFNDLLDNQIVYYRLFLTDRDPPDEITMQLRIGSGSVRGVVRVTGYTSPTVVSTQVLSSMGGTAATVEWQESQWSEVSGWPTAVRIHEGRLWWFGLNGIWASISDAFDSFDETFEGDAGPISRSIGSGPVDTINWGLSVKALLLGAQGAEFSVRASSLDEVITPTNFNVKSVSTQGSGAVEAVKIDQSACFVNRSGTRVFDVSFDLPSYEYGATNLMELVPELGQPGIVRMDVQRLPDTRLHCIRGDGTALVAVWNRTEDVLAWIPITTDGVIEDVAVLPALDGDLDDQVYYVVRRTIDGNTVRYLEKFAQEEDCLGDDLCFLADSFVSYTGAATTTITGLDHLEGEEVVVWADGADVGTDDSARPWTQLYTVSGGQIELAEAATNVVVGLGYTGQFKSTKLGMGAPGLSPLNRKKNIDQIGLVLLNTHRKGLKYGPTLDDTGSQRMFDMPGVEGGTAVTTEVRETYDETAFAFGGTWTTDSRVCLQAQAPRPVTVCAVTLNVSQS